MGQSLFQTVFYLCSLFDFNGNAQGEQKSFQLFFGLRFEYSVLNLCYDQLSVAQSTKTENI